MAISDYASLQTAVAGWLNRPDLTAQVPDFVTLAEARLNRELKNIRAMEVTTTLTTVTGTASLALPVDMLEMRRLRNTTLDGAVLDFMPPDALAARYPTGVTAAPQAFTVVGGNLELAPAPDAAYALALTYFQKLPALSGDNPTNWLLAQWPDAYLWTSLAAAQLFIMNDARLGTFLTLSAQAIKGINEVDWFSGSTMRVRAR